MKALIGAGVSLFVLAAIAGLDGGSQPADPSPVAAAQFAAAEELDPAAEATASEPGLLMISDDVRR